MKSFILIGLLLSSTSYGSINPEDIDCYSDMSDGDCKLAETKTSYKAECSISVTITLKNGEKVPTVLEGKFSQNKKIYALLMNEMVKENTVQQANIMLYEQLTPFFTMKSCQ